MNRDPENFGKYKLLKKVGTGGMAELFLARHSGIEGFEKLFVIKRILPNLADSDEFIQMFLDEARLAAQLNHPNIVQIYDLGRVENQYFIAMEYVNGVDLIQIIKKELNQSGRIPIRHVVKMLSYVCEALTYAHTRKDSQGRSLGLVHRDVSPQNVLVSFDGGVKLTDFGIAKASTQMTKTKAGTLKGKYSYMSPEQCLGHEVDQRSDIFAIGILLYRMTTGVLPFTGSSEFSALHAIVHKAPRPPTVLREDFPVGLLPILERVLAKNPEDRYQNTLALQVALENFLIAEKAISNAALIGHYVRELFPEAVKAQAKAESGGKTSSVAGILSAIEIVEKATQATTATEKVDKPPASKDAGEAGGLQEKPTHVFAERSGQRSSSSRVWLLPAIIAVAFSSAVVGALLVHYLSQGQRADLADSEIPEDPVPEVVNDGGVDQGDKLTKSGEKPVPAAADAAVSKEASVVPSRGDGGKIASSSQVKNRKKRKKRTQKLGQGFLSMVTQPWTEVWVNGKKLGETPFAYKKLPVGRHKVRMLNKALGIDKSIWVRIRLGETTAVRENLQK